MEKKEPIKISLSTALLIIAIIIIIIMGLYIYFDRINNEKLIQELSNNKINNSESIVTNNANTTNNSVSTTNQTSNVANNTNQNKKTNVIYEINKVGEAKAIIKATENGKTTTKNIEMSAMIDKTGTIDLQDIGKVALISESGGEFCKVHVYQLKGNEIVLLGDIDCGADMDKTANYTVENINEGTVVIKAESKGEKISKEIEMDASIAMTDVVDVLGYGKVVLVSETGGEYYGIKAYRLSRDYITGETKEIKNIGSLKIDF